MSDQYRLLKTCYFLISDLEQLLGGDLEQLLADTKVRFDGNRELMIKECQKTMKSLGRAMDDCTSQSFVTNGQPLRLSLFDQPSLGSAPLWVYSINTESLRSGT